MLLEYQISWNFKIKYNKQHLNPIENCYSIVQTQENSLFKGKSIHLLKIKTKIIEREATRAISLDNTILHVTKSTDSIKVEDCDEMV